MLAAFLPAACAPVASAGPGFPELLGNPGYLIKQRSSGRGDARVVDRMARLGERDGKRKEQVRVLARLDPTYLPRGGDNIELAVRCGEVVWLVRETNDPAPDGIGTLTRNRLYWFTESDSGQITSAEVDEAFDAGELSCDRDGSVYASGYARIDGSYRDVLLRVAAGGAPSEVRTPKRRGDIVVTRDGLAYLSGPRGRTTLLGRDGSQRITRPRNTTRWRYGSLTYDGRRLFFIGRDGRGNRWVRPFTSRRSGLFVDGIGGSVTNTFCGGLVIDRELSLSKTELLFLRRGRLVRRIMTQAAPVTIDPERGLVAHLSRVYQSCGNRVGRVRARLSTGASSASNLLGARDSS